MKIARALLAVIATTSVLALIGVWGCSTGTSPRYAWDAYEGNSAFRQAAVPAIQGPFDEVWVIARDGEGNRAASQRANDAQDDIPGTGSLVSADMKRPFPLERTTVRADIAGPIASVQVAQRFGNPYSERIEAVYVFPLPDDAAVSDFVLETNGRRIRGIIREREEARAVYEQARSQGYLASLLEQQRANIFRESVANIEPGKSVDVTLTFANASEYKDGAWEWRFPMVVGPRFNSPEASARATPVKYLRDGERSGADIDLEVQLDAGAALTSLDSPSHTVNITDRKGSCARIALSPNDRIPNKDFVLRYATAVKAPSHSYVWTQSESGEGTLALTIMPPAQLQDLPRTPLEVIFVVDTSGSMSGRPIEQAKRAIASTLSSLTPEDRFNIVTFSNDASAWAQAMTAATSARVAEAKRFVEGLHASGGTYIEKGLRAALSVPHEEGSMRCLIFVTDAFIGQEEETLRELRASGTRDRVFALGVGSSVNWAFLRDMARVGRGAVASVALNDDASVVAAKFMDRVRTPVMHTLSVSFEGAYVRDQVPSQLDDLVAGQPVTMLAHFNGAPPRKAIVTGYVGSRAVRVPIDLRQDAQQHPAIATMWARQRLAELSLEGLCGDQQRIRSEMLQTALANNLMSPFTSFIVVDGSRVTEGRGGVTVQQPVHMPEGVRYETTVSGAPH